MKIDELLLETPQEQRVLENVARSLYSLFEKKANTLVGMYEKTSTTQVLDVTVGDEVSVSDARVQEMLEDTEVLFVFYGDANIKGINWKYTRYKPDLWNGVYFWNNMIVVNLFNRSKRDDPMMIDNNGKYVFNRNAITSILVHELQHRIDHAKAGEATNLNKMFRGEYVLQDGEINARFTQMSMELNSLFTVYRDNRGVDMSFNDYLSNFLGLANKHDLGDTLLRWGKDEDNKVMTGKLFPVWDTRMGGTIPVQPRTILRVNLQNPKYRGLVRRLYKMYQHMKDE